MRTVALIATLFAVGAALAIPALAHTERYKSRVTIEHPEPGIWEGDVKSPRDGCVRNRLVRLFAETGKEDFFLDDDRTDAQGHWEIEVFIGDDYYAKVTRAVKRPGDHKHVCKGDTSPTIP